MHSTPFKNLIVACSQSSCNLSLCSHVVFVDKFCGPPDHANGAGLSSQLPNPCRACICVLSAHWRPQSFRCILHKPAAPCHFWFSPCISSCNMFWSSRAIQMIVFLAKRSRGTSLDKWSSLLNPWSTWWPFLTWPLFKLNLSIRHDSNPAKLESLYWLCSYFRHAWGGHSNMSRVFLVHTTAAQGSLAAAKAADPSLKSRKKNCAANFWFKVHGLFSMLWNMVAFSAMVPQERSWSTCNWCISTCLSLTPFVRVYPRVARSVKISLVLRRLQFGPLVLT